MGKLAFFLMGILCLSLVSALNVSEQHDTDILIKGVDNSITLTLSITNASAGMYNVYTLAELSMKPSSIFKIPGGSIEKDFTISANENLDVEGYYTFTYILNHRDVEKINNKLTIQILNLGEVLEVSSDSIDPESGEVSFYIENKENVQLENISAQFSSILFDIEKTFSIGPYEKVEIPVVVDVGKLQRTKAGVYIIEAIFQTNKGTEKIEGNLYLGEKKGVTSTEDNSGLLLRTQTVTKINVGNIVETVEIKLKRNIFSRLFTSFNIEPTTTERKGLIIEYSWIKERLNPTEVYIVKAKTNYIFPFFTILFAIIALLGLKRFTETKLQVKKSVHHVKTKNGEFALKITLALKAKKNIENVSIIDKVPAIVKIYKKFGLIKPDKIDATSRRIHWNIGDLDAGEERVFNYVVYSKVGVVGKFLLPEALAVFEKNGKIHEVESNKVFFMSDQIRGN
jgi:hypothetical protein